MPKTASKSFSREPKQDRSKASLERLMNASRQLLADKGYSEFTLQELSKISKVSIGSIYNRFKGKDDLLRQLQTNQLNEMDKDVALIINNIRRQRLELKKLVPLLIEEFGGFLKKNQNILRPLMEIAAIDDIVAEIGKKHFAQNLRDFEQLLIDKSNEFNQPNCERAADVSMRLVYAALARQLGLGTLGSAAAGANEEDWDKLLIDLSHMVLFYLLGKPEDVL
jgi:AcrR family transcriptional regulator